MQELIKMGKKRQKNISYILQLLIAQDLWQAHYRILSIIFLKEFIELNVNSDTMIKNEKLVKLNISNATMFLNTQMLKMF